jgi:dihydropteroate synthase
MGYRQASTKIGSHTFAWGTHTYVMGILNVTPDSFSGDGLLQNGQKETPLARGLRFIGEGADILDVGAESTRPGAAPIDTETEIARLIPVIRSLREATDTPISVDTYKAQVARAALDAGADMVNDVWGLQMDPEMAVLVAERRVPVVIMHNRSKPRNAAQEERLGSRYIGVHYDDLVGDILLELSAQIDRARLAGVGDDQIIIDPGIGFGKTVEQNLELLWNTGAFARLGYPILVGPSRKSFIGYTLDLPQEERLEGTAATVAIGIARGADIVRVHDVQAMSRVARMSDAITRRGQQT